MRECQGGNLPADTTAFIGRRGAVAEVRRLVPDAPVVTLTGPGGVGKTKLALRIAASLRRRFTGGVWLVELADAPARPPADAIASAMGLPGLPTRVPPQTLADALASRRTLLVLDNCEHLVAECAQVAAVVTRRCPGVRILATSREPLGIAAERVYAVPPLSLPDTAETLGDLASSEAAALFLARAAGTGTGLALTDADAPEIAQICRHLDGIPLAIEQAADWTRTLTPAQITQRIQDRYRFLTANRRDVATRQKTLGACIQWSWDLCSSAERLLWARLAVFAGGFGLEAMQEVCGGGALAAGDILGLAGALVDKSLLSTERCGPTLRYRLTESLREYGRERLEETGESTALRRKSRSWRADLAARVNVAVGLGIAAWQRDDRCHAVEQLRHGLRLKRGLDELPPPARALDALAWIAVDGDPERAAVLLGAAAAPATDPPPTEETSTATRSDLLAYHQRCEAKARRCLGDHAFQAAFDRGLALSPGGAIAYALAEETPAPAPDAGAAAEAPGAGGGGPTLTRRERDVVALVARGLSNQEIADELVISRHTAACHVQNILVKTGNSRRGQLRPADTPKPRPAGD